MKRLLVRSLCLALLVAITGCAASYAQPDIRASVGSPGGQVDVTYFYENLAPYGQWFQEPSYGWCWTPYDLSADWRPYSDGHWEYTDYGWSWAANETWGWAPYHYGRWFFDDSYGWVWVPGTEWAPAWVAWRYGDDYVGWAPLPPQADWDESAGLRFADASTIRPDAWCFVPRTHVLDMNVRVQVTVVARNVTLFARSRDATRFEVRGGRPANVGLDVSQVESFVGRPVPRVKVIDVAGPVRGGGQPAGNGSVGFFRPAVRPVPAEQAPPPTAVGRQQAIPDAELQRLRDQQQRKLESTLKTEQTRLARDQQNELRSQAAKPAADAVRQQHAAEQQAFEAHAAQQRQVLTQRMQKQIVNPGKLKNAGKSDGKGKGQGQGQGQGQGPDKQDKPGKQGK